MQNGSTEVDGVVKLELEEALRTIEDQKNLLARVTAEKDDTQSQLQLLQQQVCALCAKGPVSDLIGAIITQGFIRKKEEEEGEGGRERERERERETYAK